MTIYPAYSSHFLQATDQNLGVRQDTVLLLVTLYKVKSLPLLHLFFLFSCPERMQTKKQFVITDKNLLIIKSNHAQWAKIKTNDIITIAIIVIIIINSSFLTGKEDLDPLGVMQGPVQNFKQVFITKRRISLG